MTRLIFIGGFLGAGKTSLIYEISRIFKARGISFGLITNDQAPNLADTALLQKETLNIAEVAGSCFCCDFKALRKAIGKVGRHTKTDIILAEPVGSCTDLSATLIQPIREMMQTEITVAPLTVLIDPNRLRELLSDQPAMHPAAAYILRKQLEESEVIGITKTDLLKEAEIEVLINQTRQLFPDTRVHALSTLTGIGLESWLEEILNAGEAGKKILDLDYDLYARGEAVLGWLNCAATLEGKDADWDQTGRELMESLSLKFQAENIRVGHVKLLLENGDRYLAANLTGGPETLNYRWSAGKSHQATLLVNARVETTPEHLKDLFVSSLEGITSSSVQVKINHLRSLQPGYPQPTYRYKQTMA